MLGLRTQENKEFISYFELVQQRAKNINSVFFLDFGQCDDVRFKNMELDRLFGWLIPKRYVYQFNNDFENNDIDEKWDKYCMWAIPEVVNDRVYVHFK